MKKKNSKRKHRIALDLSTTVDFTTPHPGQKKILNHPARFKVIACGRRWGKSELGLIALKTAAHLEHKRCWWIAPTYQMASQIWRDLKSSVKHLRGVAIKQSERRIDLPKGGMIAVRSAHHPDNLRGEGLDLAVLDEAAFMERRVWSQIVRPMLTTTRGGALFLSTPFGRNWFWDQYRLGLDNEVPEWMSFQFSTESNPLIAPDELESIRQQTTELVWQTEYLAQFNDDSGQVFRGIRAAVLPGRVEAPEAGHVYVAGVDWGRQHDYTVIAVIDATARRLVALDRFNHIGWKLQRGRLKAMAAAWRTQLIWAEANSIGAPNIEALQEDGLPMRSFLTTSKSKSPLIESLALAIERGFIGLLDDPVLLGELASFSMERVPGGGYRYGAPPGTHDDTVIATALAWYGVENGGIGFDFA